MKLSDMATNGTTDGKPWIEPQPEIGKGYRLAMTEDVERRDRQQWNPQDLAWYCAPTGMHAGNITYRVPVDRIPTDKDAKQRPTVMVRDGDTEVWQRWRLIAVADRRHRFITLSSDATRVVAWGRCRFPYPGELD
jgi:hypothetical protein